MTGRVVQALRRPVVSSTGWVCHDDDDVVEGLQGSLLLLHQRQLFVPVIVTYVERDPWGRVVAVEARREDNGRIVEARETMPFHEASAALLKRNPAAAKTRRRAQLAVASSLLLEGEPVWQDRRVEPSASGPPSTVTLTMIHVRANHRSPLMQAGRVDWDVNPSTFEVGEAFGMLCARAAMRARRRLNMRAVDGAVVLRTFPTDVDAAAAELRPILQAMLRGGGVWFNDEARSEALRDLREAQIRARAIIGDEEELPPEPSRWTPFPTTPPGEWQE